MDDKVFSLLEKLYIEFTEFKTETNNRFDRIEGRLDKLELGQEKLDDKVSEAFEAIESLVQVNEVQHKEILSELKGDIRVIELAVKKKNYSKDKIK